MQKVLEMKAIRTEYLLNCQIEGKAQGTLDIYELVTRLFLEFLDGGEITTHQIRSFLFWLSEKRNSTTVNGGNCRCRL